MTKYRIEIRNSPNWRQYDATTLGVSVQSPRWQGEKLASILEFAATNFSTIRIDVTDALYRHNFMAQGMGGAEALAYANSLGSLWLAQHADMIESCPVKPTIVRWADWYKHPDYERVLAGFKGAYALNEAFRGAVHNDIMGFYVRQGREPYPHEYEMSKNYITEEVAVMCLQGRTLPSLEIYPGEELDSFRIVRAGGIPEAPKGLELSQFAKIKFADRPKVRPGVYERRAIPA